MSPEGTNKRYIVCGSSLSAIVHGYSLCYGRCSHWECLPLHVSGEGTRMELEWGIVNDRMGLEQKIEWTWPV